MATSPPLAAALALAAIAAAPLAAQETRFTERVLVSKVILEVRILGRDNLPILGLTATDFAVTADGVPVPVENAEWIPETVPYSSGPTPEEAAGTGVPAARPGRLLVFLFQPDFAPGRAAGLVRMSLQADEFLDSLERDDQVAVVSFDSQLKLRSDFTLDRATTRRAIQEAIRFSKVSPLQPQPDPSLAASLDFDAARDAATMETGLLVLARALGALTGPKSLVLYGWGMGRFSREGVRLSEDYTRARHLLVAARTTVYALDITDADFHSLEIGLQAAAADTGGLYARTHLFPRLAMTRLESALAGHYELLFEAPQGTREIHVEVEGAPASVYHRSATAN
jgi:VWFA-related protein